MITGAQQTTALIIHVLSLIGDFVTLYFNNSKEVIFLCAINSLQHILKIFRIISFGFILIDAPSGFCYFHSFFNTFTINSSITISCLIIFTLFGALICPEFYSRYYAKMRPFVFGFILIYNATFELLNLYEPVIKGYSSQHVAESFNCSSGYRHRLYQYILSSPLFNMPFNFLAIICTSVIIYKIYVVPRKSLKKQITTRVKMSFKRAVKVLCYCVILSLISFYKLYIDISNGIEVEKGTKQENEEITNAYLFSASSGIFIFFLTNSLNQIKRKFDIKVKNDDSIIDDTEYLLPVNQEEVFTTEIYKNEI